mgnify:FL=1
MKLTKQEYGAMVKRASPPSPLLKNCLMAFLFGGGLCLLAELIFEWGRLGGMEEKAARGLCSVSLIFLSVLLTGLQVYDNIAKIAGAGTLVPITGFANAMASPAVEFKTEGFVLGMGAKLFSIAGPVIAYGTIASVLYGVICWLVSLI